MLFPRVFGFFCCNSSFFVDLVFQLSSLLRQHGVTELNAIVRQVQKVTSPIRRDLNSLIANFKYTPWSPKFAQPASLHQG